MKDNLTKSAEYAHKGDAIYCTYDYDKFKFWPTNRPCDKYKALMRKIELNDRTKACPIIVNQDFYIADGQHRFMACRELGKPIYYHRVFIPDSEMDEFIIMLNTDNKNWTMANRLNMYVSKGLPNYIELKRFMDYHKLNSANIGIATIVFTNHPTGGHSARLFNNGLLPDKWEHADSVMQTILGLEFRKKKQKAFVEAICEAKETYTDKDFKKLCGRIQRLQPQVSKFDYLQAFRNIINK